MKLIKWIVATLLAICALGAMAQTVRVESISGSGTITQGARKFAMARGQELPVGATLTTGRQSLVMLRFDDGQTVALAENTTFQVASYAFDPANPKKGGAVLNVVQGGMRVLTGALGKANPGSISIKTPTTSVGIRGSDIIVTVSINAGVPQVSVQVISGAASVGGSSIPVGSTALVTGASVNLSVTVTVSSASTLTGTAASLSSQLSVVNMTISVSTTLVSGVVGTAQGSSAPVGTVQNLKGFSTITSPDGTVRLATQNMQLFTGDTVVTTAGSQLAVQFTTTGCVVGVPGASMATMTAAATCRSMAAAIQPVSMATPSVAAAGGAGAGAGAGATASAGAGAGAGAAGTSVAGTAAGSTAAGAGAAGTSVAGATSAGTAAAGAGAGAGAGAAGSTGFAAAGGTAGAAGTGIAGAAGGTSVAAAAGLSGVTEGALAATAGGVATATTSTGFSFVGVLGAAGGGGLFAVVGAVTVVNDRLQNASGT